MKSFKEMLDEAVVQPKSKIAKFFAKKGFTILDFGYLDESESIMTLRQAIEWAKKEGFVMTKQNKTFGEYNFCFHRTPGPYQDETICFSSKGNTNGSFVKMVHHSGAVVDKS